MEVKSAYIHYPHCKHLCNYCDFYKHLYDEQSNLVYLDYLINSLEKQKKILNENKFSLKNLETIYIGGGTPSLWGKEIIRFLKKFNEYFDLDKSSLKEFSVEVDPATYKEEEILELINYGVNRFSIGVQCFDEKIFPLVDRSHDFSEIKKTLEFFQKLQVNFSVDFMIGLPEKEYKRDIEKELIAINKYNPKHMSLYILSVGESYPLIDKIPGESVVGEEYLKVSEVMAKLGFNQYEVSNYSKAGFESQHNWKYWNQESYIALGPSGSGLLVGKKKGLRYKWLPNGEYRKEELNSNQLYLEKLYTLARTRRGISYEDFSSSALKELHDFERQSYGVFENDRFVFTSKGFVILDTLIKKVL